MANAVYPKALETFLGGGIDMLNDNIAVVLLDATATYSSSDQFLDDVAAPGDQVAQVSLTTKSVTNGYFNADDATFTALTGSTVTSWVLFKDTGTDSTSPVIAWFDTKADTTSYSFTPNGSDYTLVFDALGIIRI